MSAATGAADRARTRLTLAAGGVAAAVLLSLLPALVVSRRISGSLRRLAGATARVRDELPRIVRSVRPDDEPDPAEAEVVVTGRDEVSRLAAALVDVNRVTLDLAREQARLRAAVGDLSVDVARRNQVLLSRQLAIVDQLERVEGDGDVLEDLYRIDHLATWMRRNAESLLVVSGSDSGRRLREPMALSDVVRTATSEIEHYPRVALSLAADPAVSPHLALATAHLLAELLENATSFSHPASTVVVSAAATPDGVRVVVEDQGRGMTDDELAEAQARLDEPPTAEAMRAEQLGPPRLGLAVVGLLARRLDVRVTLRPGPEGYGLAAVVDLPPSLFVPAPASHPAAPALRPAPQPVPQLLPVSHGTAMPPAAPVQPFVPVAPAPAAAWAEPAYEPGEQAYAADPYDEPYDEPAYEETAFGPEFGYDPDYEPELVDGYTYRPADEPVALYAEPGAGVVEDFGEVAYAEPYVGHELDAEPAYEPAYDEPAYDEPAYDEPAYDEPAGRQDQEAGQEVGQEAGQEVGQEAGQESGPAGADEQPPAGPAEGWPEILAPSIVEVLPQQRVSIRTALLRGRRRPVPRSEPAGRRDNFAELADPAVEQVDYEGIPAQRAAQDDAPLPGPLLPWQRDEG